jgi:uncharacterized protein YegL
MTTPAVTYFPGTTSSFRASDDGRLLMTATIASDSVFEPQGMRSGLVMVLKILRQDAAQMMFVKDDDVIQTFAERRKVEMLFAHLKRNLNFRRLRLRGMTGARDECTLAAVAQNLRKLVKLIGFSPPGLSAACA